MKKDIFQKNWKIVFAYVSEHCASFFFLAKWIKMFDIWTIYIWKNKNRNNREIDFLFGSEHWVLFLTKKWKRPFLRKEEGGGLHIFN